MQICIDFRPALHQSTGVGTYVRGLLQGLLQQHPEHRYTAFSASWKHRVQAPPSIAEVRFVDVRLPVRALDWLWHRHRWPPIETWVGDQDIVHSPSPMPIPTRGARQIVTVHDCYFLRHPDQVTGPMRRDYARYLRRSLDRADAVMTNTQTTRQELLQALDVAADKVHVTPLGVDPVFEYATAPQLPAHLELPSRYLLFVGRREPRKDPATLLAAFDRVARQHPEMALLLVGPEGLGWQAHWGRTSDRVRNASRCLGHQSPRSLAAIYSHAEALLLPSRWEGFGLTAIEAMAMGTPVIAARAGALPEVLGNAPMWFDVGDDRALADACMTLLHDQNLRARLSGAGRKRAARYRWSHTADLTHEVYRHLQATM